MLFYFIFYKINLMSASKRYGLKCNYFKNGNFMLRNFLAFSRYFYYLKKGDGIPQKLFNKIHSIQKKYYVKYDELEKSKDRIDDLLCSWIAIGNILDVEIDDFLKVRIEEENISELSKRYLFNRVS